MWKISGRQQTLKTILRSLHTDLSELVVETGDQVLNPSVRAGLGGHFGVVRLTGAYDLAFLFFKF